MIFNLFHRRLLVPAALYLLPFYFHYFAFSQETYPVEVLKEKSELVYAFTNVTILIDYRTVIQNGTLIVKDGKVEYTGPGTEIPAGAIVKNLPGKFIYPSFIDLFSSCGIRKETSQKSRSWREGGPQYERSAKGPYHWNEAVRPETDGVKLFHADSNEAGEYRSIGFGAVLTHNTDGIARGTSSIVLLGTGKENELVLREKAAHHFSFNKGSSKQEYPSSLMGTIALMRQTYLDGTWYKNSAPKTEKNISLEAWNRNLDLPQIFEANDKSNILRADRLGDEFGVQYIIKGSGDEYQRLDEIKNTNASLIVPINFPPAFDVTDPYDAMQVSLPEMKHWEMAPHNLALLQKYNIPFAITSYGLKNKSDFLKNIRKAIECGLHPEEALKALTIIPAQLMRMEDKVGSLKKGMTANFIITTDSVFREGSVILQNWVKGKPYILNDETILSLPGIYGFTLDRKNYKLTVKISGMKPSAIIEAPDSARSNVSITVAHHTVTLSFSEPASKADSGKQGGTIRLSGYIDYSNPVKWAGRGQAADGNWIDWSAVYQSAFPDEKKKPKQDEPVISPDTLIIRPFLPYGWKNLPKQETVLVKNTTVWTNEPQGILNESDVLVQNGKIVRVGKNIPPPNGSKIVDGTGKHLTPGIIDEHSHIAIAGNVNEGAQAVSAEVRIGDVVNPDDISIYRQLAGGVTTSHLLHGSANPIGGQTSLIKLRWGYSPEKMKFENSDPFIKFALGENVKQSNWGDRYSIRFPQTRMGVEQVYYDAFIRAKEYREKWNTYNSLPAKDKTKNSLPRRDLELDALAEVLESKRFVTCHSYVQSEINMIMHVADSMKFCLNTFTHILEGYKVADKMKKHGAAASSFADWWAYKFEVKEAIPYNGSLLNRVGVVTAFNSDDADMARRLNQEAAKAVKYGNTSEEDALKMVTLNPAKMLHIDNRTGSIKPGKDADLVLWSDHPLSVYATVEKTLVDGICFYDKTEDERLRIAVQNERNRIIQKMIAAKKQGAPVVKPRKKEQEYYRCGDE